MKDKYPDALLYVGLLFLAMAFSFMLLEGYWGRLLSASLGVLGAGFIGRYNQKVTSGTLRNKKE